jgi:hypothetical protein
LAPVERAGEGTILQITEHSHFVPRRYLARWSTDGIHVWEHKFAVPHENYPVWRRAPLREACARRNLYEAHLEGFERDHFEKWFNLEIETPAYAALDRLEAGAGLCGNDTEALVRFAVAQDLRTPKDWNRYDAWQTHVLPSVMERIVEKTVRKFKPGLPYEREREPLPTDERRYVETSLTPTPDGVLVEMSVSVGSTAWVQRTKRMVRELTPKAVHSRWHIIRPHPGRSWPTCDHPLVRFEERQGFAIHGTGWLRKNTEIFLPLSPQLALYTKVGSKAPVPGVMNVLRTHFFVRLIVGHTDRSVFSNYPNYKWVEWEKRRYVNRERFNAYR